MSQTVIDFGAVDWGKIWGDRASLVSPAHLVELNSISAQTHLSSPGYWRNLFASYPEVKIAADKIARVYTRPGQVPKTFETHSTTPIMAPGMANKFNEDKRKEAIAQRDAMMVESDNFSKNPFNVAGAVMGQKVKDTEVYKKGETVVNKVAEVGTKVGEVGQSLLNTAKNISDMMDNETKNASQTKYVLLAFGVVLTGAYVYSAAK